MNPLLWKLTTILFPFVTLIVMGVKPLFGKIPSNKVKTMPLFRQNHSNKTSILYIVLAFAWLPISENAVTQYETSVQPERAYFVSIGENGMGQLQQRNVKAGKHKYSPGHGLGFAMRKTGFHLDFAFDSTAWFDSSTDGPLGTDGTDWNKVGGVTTFALWNPLSWPANRGAALVAWRPNPLVEGVFDVAGYTNNRDGTFQHCHLFSVPADVVIYATVGRWGKEEVAFRFTFWLDGEKHEYDCMLPYKPWGWQTNVGPWFGGNRRSPINHHIYTRLR